MKKTHSQISSVSLLPNIPQDVLVLLFHLSNGFIYAAWCGDELVKGGTQTGSEDDVRKIVLSFLEDHNVEVASYQTELCRFWREGKEYID